MNYFMNEYSLRGQFSDVEQFYDSVRKNTLPVLKRVEENHENIVWKKDDLWNAQICKEVTLQNIPRKRNERTPEKALILAKLIKLVSEDPFFYETEEIGIVPQSYSFDLEYNSKFSNNNCFLLCIRHDGCIISFEHDEYKAKELPLTVEIDRESHEYYVDNIWSLDWWNTEPQIVTWYIDSKYKVEVRAKEFDYHPPHFHVSYNEKAAVFKLKDGEIYVSGKKKFDGKEIGKIREWYKTKKEDLRKAWKELHSDEDK